ncbi:MAG: PD40 domain-containing protein [Chitinispirillaceae bacterium]|nr:PD40 domain-containing protein [Chitinispirillaceae bacterium]
MKSTEKRSWAVFIFFTCYGLCAGFGKNKVQYTDFTWSTLKSPHFNLHFHQGEKTLAEIAPFWIERAYLSLQNQFQFNQKERIPLIIYGNTNLFSQTNIITELLPEGVGGFTELFKNRIAIPFNGSYNDFRHVLHHELVHAFMFGMLFEQFGSNLLSGNLQLPLWFMEGSAEYLSSGWDAEADMFMIDQALNSVIPLPGAGLDGYLAYKGGQSFLFFLASSRGDSLFQRFLIEFKKNKRVDMALKKTYRKPVEDLGKEWVSELRRLYWPEIGRRIDPATHAAPITQHLETRDHFNLRPRIAPDGGRIAFFSDRRDYTRILITDLKGKIVHEISQNGYGGYFESFHPFRSGMCWAPDGKRLAFITKSDESDELRIVDIERKRLQRRIRTSQNAISSPDWSRNGSLLVFSGVDNGRSDLFLYDLKHDSLRQLTRSVACESDPRFSPNGKFIIFSIEDTSGRLPDGRSPYGAQPSDLAALDLASDSIRRLTATPWSEKQPCFSPDGRQVLFVSNRNGIDNCFIAPFDSLDRARPLTNYTGGCSNPDWTGESDRVVFSLFNKQGWDIWLMKEPLKKLSSDSLAPTRWVASFADTAATFFKKAALPPDSADSVAMTNKRPKRSKKHRDATDGVIEEKTPPASQRLTQDSTAAAAGAPLRADSTETTPRAVSDSTAAGVAAPAAPSAATPTDSLHPRPDSSASTTAAAADSGTDPVDTMTTSPLQPYRLSFSPDLVSVGVGMSTAYSPAGQVLIALSDLLGDHRITFAGDIQGNFKDYAHLFLSYLYLKKRINVGAGGFYSKDYTFASIFGDRLYHDMEYGGFGIAQYPFSMFSRLELQLFARHIEQKPVTFDGPAMTSNMWQSSLAYVFDNILWGITGPLNGIRAAASLQVSPPLKVITEPFISVDTDIRHYWHLFKRFVWANRLYTGCSFPLGRSHSARRYLLGGNDQWLIYQVNVDEYEKNMPYTFYSDFVTPFRGWNYVDMSGTRVAVLNSEFRFPFIREIALVWPLPLQIQYINGAVFADLGNAWEAGERFGVLPLPEKIYGGFGFGMRANLGIFILRFDRGWPTDWNTFVGTPLNYFSLGAEF